MCVYVCVCVCVFCDVMVRFTRNTSKLVAFIDNLAWESVFTCIVSGTTQ